MRRLNSLDRDSNFRIKMAMEQAAASTVTIVSFAITTLVLCPTLPWLTAIVVLVLAHLCAGYGIGPR